MNNGEINNKRNSSDDKNENKDNTNNYSTKN